MGVFDGLVSMLEGVLGLGGSVTLTQAQQAALARYGGYQLQLNDDDTPPPVYEGSQRTPPDPLPQPGADGFVTMLQKDLQQLGFYPAWVPNGKFDRLTSWLVREFQIYAGMDTVATENANAAGSYADRLVATANAEKYQGQITGRLDGNTAVALQAWITNNYRCPVVAESRDQNFNLINDNVWFPPEDPTNGHLCWVTDLTGTYTVDPLRLSAQGGLGDPHNRRILAGSYTTQGIGGPICQAATPGVISTVWSDADPSAIDAIPQWTNITIESLTGDSFDQASAQTRSTYKVIRAVTQFESGATFDGVNSWDTTRVSFGPYQFALFLNGRASELPAFLSFLATALPEDFNAAFGRYGIGAQAAWPDATAPAPRPLYFPTERKWATYLQQFGLETWSGIVSVAQNDVVTADDADYFKNWHWFYRWVMACRLFPNIWLKCWNLCRYRLQALLNAPCRAAGLIGGTTLGQVYTSEKAVTALLRVHVNRPAAIIQSPGRASNYITDSIANAITAGNLPNNPAQWTNNQHQDVDTAMVQALLDAATTNNWPYRNDLDNVLAFAVILRYDPPPQLALPVDHTAGSFQFDPP